MKLVKKEVKQMGSERFPRWKMRSYIRLETNESADWQDAFDLAQTAPPNFCENDLCVNYPYWRVVGKRIMVSQTIYRE